MVEKVGAMVKGETAVYPHLLSIYNIFYAIIFNIMTDTITIDASNTNLKQLLRDMATNREVVIMQNGRPVARLLPYAEMASQDEVTPPDMPRFHVPSEGDKMDAEIAAYEAQYKMLIDTYLNQYVAFHQGELIDHDTDRQALLSRIDHQHPHETILIRKVEETLPQPLKVRSPRLRKLL